MTSPQKKTHFCFVILHYGDADITTSAINSICVLDSSQVNVSIIVVDNASPNGTGLQIQKQFERTSNFYFISNRANLGFAKGNNVGFLFAKNNLQADFIILMNNDIVIESNNFFDTISKDYDKEKFAVLGPNIYTPNGKQQNPLRKKMLKGVRLKATIAYLHLDWLLTSSFIVPLIFKIFHKIKPKKASSRPNIPINNVELHGSFLIFSPLYIQEFDGLYDKTFMYCEEEFLFARCIAKGLNSRYNPTINVFHNETENRNDEFLKTRNKRLFRIKNCIRSLSLYKKFLKETFNT